MTLKCAKFVPMLAAASVACFVAAAPVNAATISIAPMPGVTTTAGNAPVELVRHKSGNNRNFRYDRRKHGHRYRSRRHGFNHYHDGYWYRTPYWTLAIPLIIGGATASSNRGSHVNWCDNRYRSYDRGRDAFKGYDGRWHRCNSPYN